MIPCTESLGIDAHVQALIYDEVLMPLPGVPMEESLPVGV